jgi:hypothetical protein
LEIANRRELGVNPYVLKVAPARDCARSFLAHETTADDADA